MKFLSGDNGERRKTMLLLRLTVSFLTSEQLKCGNAVLAYLSVCVRVDVAVTFIWTVTLYAVANAVFSANHFALASGESLQRCRNFLSDLRGALHVQQQAVWLVYIADRGIQRELIHLLHVRWQSSRCQRKTFKTRLSAVLFAKNGGK